MKNIIIFKGEESTEEYRKEFSFSEEEIVRDLTQSSSTKLKVWDEEKIIEELDTCYISDYAGLTLTGRIVQVERDDESLTATLSIKFGADVYYNEVYLPNNSLQSINLSENNLQNVTVNINSNDSVTTSNNFLDFDVLCRQSMRKSPKQEEHLLNEVNITDDNSDVLQMRIDDPDITNRKVILADDQYNVLTLYNQDDLNQSQTYYLLFDGTVTTDNSFQQLPQITQYEVVGSLEYNDINVATDKMKQQEYNNLIEFDVPIKTNIIPLKLDNKLLSRKLIVWLENNTTIETIISSYQLKNELYMHIKLGLTRTKLTENLQGGET